MADYYTNLSIPIARTSVVRVPMYKALGEVAFAQSPQIIVVKERWPI